LRTRKPLRRFLRKNFVFILTKTINKVKRGESNIDFEKIIDARAKVK